MKSQACISCARRKVRCDREEPCSNCKRRKQDCSFPEVSPSDRIKRLEALVRSLGGDPDEEACEELGNQPFETSLVAAGTLHSADARAVPQSLSLLSKGEVRAPSGNDSIILRTGDQTLYLESFTYHSWDSSEHASKLIDEDQKTFRRAPALSTAGTDALQSVITSFENVRLADKLPNSYDAAYLWTKYRQRVHPLHKLLFDWELDMLQVAATENPDRLDPPKHALVYATYLLSAISLSEDECLQSLARPRSALISEFQTGCEQALAQSGFLWAADIVVIQALTTYLAAGLDRLSVKSLWSLMGLTIRNAERLGVHRDGALFGISPVETERRRRLWWLLQHLDLGMTIQAGAMPLTLMADWDTRLPLNIEDSDLQPDADKFPEERKGLTSMSHCLFIFWVIREQRCFRRDDGTRLGLTWTSDRAISRAKREVWLKQLEDNINQQFLQYCEPIKSSHVMVQYVARAFICTMRRVMLHSFVQAHGLGYDNGVWEELLDACVQCIEYNIAMQTNPLIEQFRWRMKSYFQWSALVCLILEAGRQRDLARIRDLWDLLSRLYAVNDNLRVLQDDRRRFYAAELIVASWKAHEDLLLREKPAFVSALEAQLPEPRASASRVDGAERPRRKRKAEWPAPSHSRPPPGGGGGGGGGGGAAAGHMDSLRVQDDFVPDQIAFTPSELDMITDLQFDDIDWAFWNSVS